YIHNYFIFNLSFNILVPSISLSENTTIFTFLYCSQDKKLHRCKRAYMAHASDMLSNGKRIFK
ncbi:hypothetical protein, partial [uncultured Chryseobacterium sp.]|uniref:hypothetical protein n=1 Tax=uncultured Chryseobacterium sp. TaxID=259322 RepID=UPI0025D042C8